jgi:lysozyme
MKTSSDGIDLIAKWEGFIGYWYPDPATGGPPMTCCYGHTDAAGSPKYSDDPDREFTEAEGKEILARDVVQYENAVSNNCPGPTTQHQFDAMVSLTFNIGPGNFDGSSVERYHNEKNYPEAAESFLLWNKANGQVMQGLINRREDEKKHYEMQDTVVEPEPIDPDEITKPPDEWEHPPPVEVDDEPLYLNYEIELLDGSILEGEARAVKTWVSGEP